MAQIVSPADAGRGSPRPALALAQRYRDADRDAYEHLQDIGFQGPEQERLETRLLTYCWPMLMGWLITGEIYNRVRDIGRPVSRDPMALQTLQIDPEARADLVQDTMVSALALFREQLKEGKWDAERGSLVTYFLGAVVRSFPNAYRGWMARRRTEARVEPMGVTPEELSPGDVLRSEENMSASVEAQETAERFFKMLKSPDREVAQMVYDGFSVVEIAAQFKVTPDAIRRRLRRMKDTAVLAELV